MKKFCIAGPINPKDHYYIPQRLKWNELNGLIESKLYFVLHAPRQSGKTTAIREYIRYLLIAGNYIPFYLSLESAHNKPAVRQTFITILEQAKREIEKQFQDSQLILDQLKDVFDKSSTSEISLYDFLSIWSRNAPKPLVIFFDEADGLQGDALIDFLKQIRTGYTDRPDHFPQSICFIGVRDLRDYKIKTGGKADQLSWVSPFNIKAESILLPNFTLEQIQQLYEQHTQETGQLFTPDAVKYAFHLTQGQPWLVNALAHEACFRDVTDRLQPITKDVIERAKNKLILRQDTHLDALIDRLKDPRVFPIIDAIISGKDELHFNHDDVQYVRDLGLLTPGRFAIANPIYQEVIPRALVFVTNKPLNKKQLGMLILQVT